MKFREEPLFNIVPVHKFGGYSAPALPVMKSECNGKYEKAIELAKQRSGLSRFNTWKFL